MAFKTFANGFPLPASDLNNFLMKQSVIVFADAAARTAALPEPTEGMVTYLEDTNLLEVFTGASFVPVAEEADLTTLIPKSTVTTAGDLIVADGAGSVTRLGIGAVDTVLTSDGTTATWETPGGGGFSSLTEITSSNASFDVSAISGFAKFTVIGAGGGAAYANATGAAGGSTSVVIGGTTVTASGGRSVTHNSNTTDNAEFDFTSSNGGRLRGTQFTDGQEGAGGQVKMFYADLTSVNTINVTIGAEGAGQGNGFRGVVIMESS